MTVREVSGLTEPLLAHCLLGDRRTMNVVGNGDENRPFNYILQNGGKKRTNARIRSW